MQLTKKSKALVAGVALVGLAGTGTAYAFFSTTGSGTGSATTSTGQTAGFTVAGGIGNAMYPGDGPQTGTATVTNNSTTESAHLASVTAYLTILQASGAVGSCTSADYLLNGTAAPGTAATARDLNFTAIDIVKSGTATKTFTMQFNNSATADQSGCKGAAVTINYVAA